MPKVKIVGIPSKGLKRFDIGGVTDTTTFSPMFFPGITDTPTTQSPFTFNWMGTDTTTTDGIVPPYSSDYKGPIDPAARGAMITPTTTISVASKKCPDGYYEDKDGKCVPNKKAIQAVNDITQATLAAGNVVAQVFENKLSKEWGEKNRRDSTFTGMVQNPGREFAFGNQATNMYQFPGSMAPPNEGQYGAFGGSFISDQQAPTKLRIKIIDAPDDDMATMEYGGQAGYGLDMNWRKSFTKMNKTSSDYYTNGMSEDRTTDEEPVLEAEGGETIFKPGDQTMFSLNGPKHSKGGIPLTKDQVESKNKPDLASFIFSDTNKMKIKDKDILEHFDVAYEKGGVTPAKVSKKYDLNKWQAILNDTTSDPVARTTAQLMLNKNIPRLAELAVIQEKMKGLKPPAFAEQMLGGGRQQGQDQQAGPGAQMATGRFGGSYATGGVTNTTTIPVVKAAPPASTANVKLGEFSSTYDQLEKLIKNDRNKELRSELFNRFKKANPNTKVTEDQYIENLLIAQKQNYAINAAHANDPNFLNDPSWDWGDTKTKTHGAGWKNKRYKEEVKKAGLSPLDSDGIKQFQQAYRDLADAMKDPKFFESFGKYFKIDPVGKPDQQYKGQAISPVEGFWGNTTRGQLVRASGWVDTTTTEPPVFVTTTRQPDTVTPKYICIPDGKGGGKVVESSGSGYGYATPEEASKHCGERAKRAPYDFLLPDKINMLAKAAFAPEMILPFNPDLAFSPRHLNLEYWDAPAAAAFATQYAAPSSELNVYGPTQGQTANKAFLSGQAAQTITGQIMPGVIARNVDRTNAFSSEEAKRQDTIDAYNNMQKQKRWEGWATAKQNTTNAWRQYLKENSDAFTRAWDNRQNWGDINDTNTQFYKNFNTGRQTFYNPDYAGRAGVGGGGGDDVASLGSKFNSYYNTFYNQLNDPNLSEEQRKEQAAKWATAAVESNRTSTTSDPYKNQYKVKTTGFKS